MIDDIWNCLRRVREAAPLVHNITNFVVMNNTANALLAAGASPVMAHAPEEVEDFVAISGALVVNIGTLSSDWIAAMRLAALKAGAAGKPWVLDPVGVGATAFRSATAAVLVEIGPTVVRGNASEILALADAATEATRGVDSTVSSDLSLEAARRIAAVTGGVVAVTGATDYVTDGRDVHALRNGDAMMGRVTGLGCSASALVGAFLAVEPDPLLATTAALAVFGVAGEIAAENAPGPGTLQLRLYDTLYALDRQALQSRLRLD
ncbi:hydroxyethylthiazole kinase [Faunimonas pinastri]|uniref:Hydroxyethylthiazole kinase n=1 Tax=Faunimonas pinastri TaxID=1855383 RepID=A0A1H9NQR0_9HYPH|nr:hydroxyethylthiazole kinase [Faunimonas pinastri]SER38242.1 hydroxyethylthiazole kinase [Faunimonas pinastri]